jgi:hypothetical protein
MRKDALPQESMHQQLLTYMERSLTQVLMRQQDRLFEKVNINFGISGVSGVREWISQTRCKIN